MHSPDARERPNAQALASFVWSLAKLPLARPSIRLLDVLCGCFLEKLQSSAAQHPKAQETANIAWALQQLKHVPPAALATAILDRMVYLCQGGNQHAPNAQEISNLLLAWADLRLQISWDQADNLLTHLLAEDTVTTQHLANSAWSLAVSGLLQLTTFTQLLHRFHAIPASVQNPNTAEMHQLFQCLEWLRPAPAARLQDHQTWSELQAQVQCLGTRPQLNQTFFGSTEMRSALKQLGLQFSLGVYVKGYLVTAVVQAQISTAHPILCAITTPDCFTNEPAR